MQTTVFQIFQNGQTQVMTHRNLSHLSVLLMKSQAVLFSSFVEVHPPKLCNGTNASRCVNQNANDGTISASDVVSSINALQQTSSMLDGDLRCLPLNRLMPFRPNGQGRLRITTCRMTSSSKNLLNAARCSFRSCGTRSWHPDTDPHPPEPHEPNPAAVPHTIREPFHRMQIRLSSEPIANLPCRNSSNANLAPPHPHLESAPQLRICTLPQLRTMASQP